MKRSLQFLIALSLFCSAHAGVMLPPTEEQLKILKDVLIGDPIEHEMKIPPDIPSFQDLDNHPRIIEGFKEIEEKDRNYPKGMISNHGLRYEFLLIVDEKGNVKKVEILKAKYGDHARGLMMDIKNYKFEEPLINDNPTGFYLRLPMTINLEKLIENHNKALEEISSSSASRNSSL